MLQAAELREKIRQVVENVSPSEPESVEKAVDCIMEAVDPFRQTALEEMDRFRATFIELAK